MAAPRQGLGRDPPVTSPQAPVTFEDVAVRFSAEEWELLEEWQRELHREVTEGTSRLLASLGRAPPRCLSQPERGRPALSALVRLVKEIPEFLFGGPRAGAEPGAAGGADVAAGSEQTGAGGALAPVVPPGSLAETRASGARGTAAPGDARPAGGTRPPSRPPAKGTATKRPPAEEELERPCRDLRSVRREVWGVRSRLERLERGWAREMAALAHCRRRLRRAIRRLEGRRRALETRSRRNSLRLLGLPEGAEGADAIAFLQTTLPAVLGLPPAPAPLQIESARRPRGPTAPARPLLFSPLRFADKLALLRAARGCPEPPSWAGARLAVVPGRRARRAVERPCGTRCPAAGRGRGSTGP
ncbi:hypothetical protein QYF61_001510 [Mycteria americana]|uniref:KRAB domain-containing protein n=1 Tax=Mycteria americana TaxID=33587 RepID=A0AAN7NI18_MYCAM|nr:hypothetical protein QYF61_001510 [Mycteria americana]